MDLKYIRPKVALMAALINYQHLSFIFIFYPFLFYLAFANVRYVTNWNRRYIYIYTCKYIDIYIQGD